MDERARIQLMSLDIQSLKKQFGKNLILNENLSKYSWFNLGGPAEIFFRPDSKEQLINFLIETKKRRLSMKVIGAGSNTLIRDKGVKGTIIKLSSKFSFIKMLTKDTIEVGAATLDRKISDFAMESGIGNFEFLSCIPGSIGGSITMNSGCYGTDISEILLSIKVINDMGIEKEIKKNEIKFLYRGTNIPENYIILSAVLKGKISTKEEVHKKQEKLIKKKEETQPKRLKTGGSTFKNSTNKKAWELIKESGCDKLNIGDAKISEKHCNFFINNGNAKTADIEELINKVKKQVHSKTGVTLELEIKIIGDEI